MNMNTEIPYVPVSCELHSILELAIIQHKDLLLHWQTPKGEFLQERVHPVDVITSNRQEYLIVNRGSQQHIEIRLDQIKSVEIIT
jgi:transcriptional antiterminator Rof (Rho-off)